MPAGHILRPPASDDAPAVAELLRACDEATLGEPEITVADVETEWTSPAVALERDAWVVEGDDDRIVAYALVNGPDLLVAVHPDADARRLGRDLLVAAERRARERNTRVVRQFVPAANDAARALLLDSGWWPAHHYFRMQIALKHAPPAPDLLVRTFEERDAEQVWHLVQGAYAGVEGHFPQSFEGWRASALDNRAFDPGLWLLMHDSKGILGVAAGEQGDTGMKRYGFVTAVAVAPRAQGRGYGRALVLLLLQAFRRRGMRYAEAVVHGPTAAAADVFASAGMTAARGTERWEKVLGG